MKTATKIKARQQPRNVLDEQEAHLYVSPELILIKNGLVEVPQPDGKVKFGDAVLGTLLSNLAYYGFCPSKGVVAKLVLLSEDQVKEWWTLTERALKFITGDDKNMDRFVVCKNFPREVLEMSQAEYWIKQIFMYIGFPNDDFTETEVSRDKMFETVTLKVLQPSKATSFADIYRGLLKLPSRWTAEQFSFVQFLVFQQKLELEASLIPFKENLVTILAKAIDSDVKIKMSSAMDVLRLGTALCDGDVTFKEKTKFKFSRKYRRFLLSQLENCSNLEEDLARDKERWKRFLASLHPGDYPSQNVVKAYDSLYSDDIVTFNSQIESLILAGNSTCLEKLQTRPGEFVRRLHKLINLFGTAAVNSFVDVLSKLKTSQLLKIRGYVTTINSRKFLAFPPQGNWTKLKVVENTKEKISPAQIAKLCCAIDDVLASRLKVKFPKGVFLDEKTDLVKLQTNDSDLLPYGRGTVFEIPDNVEFIRSASYWKNRTKELSYCNIWYDNSWNFFASNWENKGQCCWTDVDYNKGAIFSGDPTSCKDIEGNACQMIDLYPAKLLAQGVRYAVWNILCFSKQSFNKSEVYGALQWGEEAQKGKLFEPARCQLAFPLKGENFTKYVAIIDLQERKLIYIDANLKGSVHSARDNGKTLQGVMPAFMEYLDALPSVWDLFNAAKRSPRGVPILYSDASKKVETPCAYVFKPENQENKYTQLVLSDYL